MCPPLGVSSEVGPPSDVSRGVCPLLDGRCKGVCTHYWMEGVYMEKNFHHDGWNGKLHIAQMFVCMHCMVYTSHHTVLYICTYSTYICNRN